MKFLQINVEEFRYFDALVAFIEQEQPDVVTMQEVVFGTYKHPAPAKDYLEVLEAMGYTVILGKNFVYDDGTGVVGGRGNAVLTRLPILDYHIHYHPMFGNDTVKTAEQLWFTLDPSIPEQRMELRMRAQTWPSTFLDVVVLEQEKPVRIITSHFPASPKCTETYLIGKHAEFLKELIEYSAPMPTIFAADCNIRKNSTAIRLLQSVLTLAGESDFTTLNPRVHPWFKNDIPPEGYQVDHILYKDISVKEHAICDVDVSDHLPLLAEFDCLQLHPEVVQTTIDFVPKNMYY